MRAGEALLKAVTESFFGPFRVSVLFDANGCNTTAAAAALGQDGDGKDRPARRVFLPGFKVPMKGLDYRDGKEERSWEVTEVKFFDSLPESTFAKPK